MSGLPIPHSVLNAHCAVLGKTGAGKSGTLRLIVEDLLHRGKRVCIIDPKGDWYGVKLSADGKSSGYPVIAFGNFVEDAASDVPINEHSGRHVAELISSGNRPCVIGFRGWMPAKMTRFWIDFASTLFNSKSGELYLIIDEVHNFAPKGKVFDVEAGRSLHWTNRLMSEGRGLGLVILIASQRPQKVHNDTLTCCEALFAMRVVHAADRSAIEDWIDGCGDPQHGKAVLASVASLEKGEAYVWCPEAKFGPQRIQFPMFKTFDSFAPPQLQKKISAAGWAGVDLDAVKKKLEAVIAEAQANDPALLRRQLAEARQELKKLRDAPALKAPKPAEKVFTREKFVLKEGQLARVEKLVERISGPLEGLAIALKQCLYKPVEPQPQRPAASLHIPNIPRPKVADRASATPSDNGVIGRCERAILTALAQYPQGRNRNQVAILSGYSVTSGGFANSLSALRTSGYITLGNPIQVTQDGLAALGGYDPLPTGEALQRYWLGKLGRCESEVLRVLLAAPHGLHRGEIAEQTNYSETSGGFANALSKLRMLELITRTDPIRAAETFFEP